MAGDLPGVAPGQELAVIDIASAQWRFGRLGTLDRVDVKLKPGTALADAKAQLSSILPANTQLSDAETESQRGDALSRAYRVNLDMLALVALLTGGFLVYSAQSLAVTRRLRQFALLRTLGLQERALAGQLLGEGAALGVVGALIGLAWRLCDRRCRVAPGRWRSRRRLFCRRDNEARVRARSGGALLRLWRRHRACRKLRARPARRPDRARAGA